VKIFVVAALAAATLLGATPDARSLLKRSDSVRNAWASFVVRVRITNFEAGRPDEEHFYQVYQKGAERTYVEFLSPREKGRYLLMLGDDMWLYLPDTSRPIRITPLERLTGNASNGDVARTNYALDYDAAYVRAEAMNGAACHVLELAARRKGATYRRILLWLRTADARPMKADYFVASGKHIKSATFDEYQQVRGMTLLRRMTIHDQIRKTSRSVMEYADFAPRELPDRIFHQGRSERY